MSSHQAAGTRRLQTVPRDTPVDDVMAIVARDGGVIIKDLLSKGQVDELNRDVDPALEALHSGGRSGVAELDDFHGDQTKRLTRVMALSRVFREEIIDDDYTLSLIDGMLLPTADSYWLGATQIIEIGPGQKAQTLHRDMGNYPAFYQYGPSGPEVACNILVALRDVTEEIGATRVIPGSNNWSDFADTGTQETTIPAEMDAGSGLLISGKVVHGGGANRSAAADRRVIAIAFNPGFLVPEEAYPFVVPLETAKTLSPRVQQMIGFRSFHNWRHEGGSLWQVDYHELADHLGLG